MKTINLLQPTADWRTIWEMAKTLRSGWWVYGKKVQEFQDEFAKKVGSKYAVAVNSATSGLDLCLKAYGITGGELITPSFTFASDAMVGEWNGMDVTFCDVNPRTFCIDVDSVKITKKTKAIIAVDCHGRLADIKGLKKKCKDAGRDDILIIEDAAHACYTPGAGKHADVTVWSFQGVKTLPTGDGGMVTTNNKAIATKIKDLSWLGIKKYTFDRVGGKKYTWKYDVTHPGIKAYMIDLTAVIGLGNLRRLEKTNARRREIQETYNKAFKGKWYFREPEFTHTVQYYTPEWYDRDGLCEYLAEHGIHTSVHFMPVSELTYWKKAKKHPIPNTDRVWLNLLSLPVHNALTNRQQDYVIKTVKNYYDKLTPSNFNLSN